MKNFVDMLQESALDDLKKRTDFEKYLYDITKCDKKVISDELDAFILKLKKMK